MSAAGPGDADVDAGVHAGGAGVLDGLDKDMAAVIANRIAK